MTTLRRCPVCQRPVGSDEYAHCPGCGAALDSARFSPDSSSLRDILDTVKKQIDGIDETDEALTGNGAGDEDKDVEKLLSGIGAGSLPDERSADDGRVDDRPGIAPDTAAAEHPSPFSDALGSLKKKHAFSIEDEGHGDADAPCPEIRDGYSEERGDYSESVESLCPELVPFEEDDEDAGESMPVTRTRTWRGITRQTFYLFLLLVVSIALFRFLAPRKEEPTIEDFFQPGNPDIEFLDALNFLEKYYARHPELRTVIKPDTTSGTLPGVTQSRRPADAAAGGGAAQAADNDSTRASSSETVPSATAP